ncbi:MAG: helix-turn-helix transcriptional regulator [Flaviaesturariibacter sp.]|nr:helix-turn-helix transcriptional regulator [Flaviaesturariibacter sp.]
MTTNSATQDELRIEILNLKKSALILRAINHKLRQQIMQLLHKRKGITVTDIYVKLRLEQSVASQHLAILRKAGLVSTTREGKCIYYAINYERVNDVQELCAAINGK